MSAAGMVSTTGRDDGGVRLVRALSGWESQLSGVRGYNQSTVDPVGRQAPGCFPRSTDVSGVRSGVVFQPSINDRRS